MTPAEVLRQAADLIEENGWWGGPNVKTGQHCAITAVGGVTNPYTADNCYRESLEALASSLSLVSKDDYAPSALIRWNDSQSSGEPIIAAMRACADALEAAE